MKVYWTLHLVDNLARCLKQKTVSADGFKQMFSLFCQLRHLLLLPNILTKMEDTFSTKKKNKKSEELSLNNTVSFKINQGYYQSIKKKDSLSGRRSWLDSGADISKKTLPTRNSFKRLLFAVSIITIIIIIAVVVFLECCILWLKMISINFAS